MVMPAPFPPFAIPDANRRDWTVADVHGLPDDGNRYEVLDGELLVTPAPSMLHQRAVRELVLLVAQYVHTVGLELFFAPLAITWSPRTEVQPDVLVLPRRAERPAERFADVGVLTLAVEVVSPSSARVDRYRKREMYQRFLVPEYWVIDASSRLVERWRPGDEEPEVLVETLTWQPIVDNPALVIDLAAYFRQVHDESR